ncbi:hypothetical protein EV356DRAFT_135530 [Viridothelium virens]|uniref:Uncharacterized protein n=1 Tax=Viridothelium virens TaxID=1048519 RepID=A0A6A6HAN5_VIRVR|nr:hypothetical protein EV356DRAFT_135530 [Viridothelium virens]
MSTRLRRWWLENCVSLPATVMKYVLISPLGNVSQPPPHHLQENHEAQPPSSNYRLGGTMCGR